MLAKLKSDRRVQLLLLLIAVLSAFFWSGSRYPSLDTKAMMAGSFTPDDGLSFDAWLPHSPDDSLLREILITFGNWLHTNQQGMLFGLAFAVLIMSLLPLVRDELDRWITRRFSATLAGALFGAPLGVCVNCAAPIGYGMYKNGARLETASALMIASPTLNIVVLGMALTLFPFYVVAIKVAATLAVILLVIPLLSARFPDQQYSNQQSQGPEGALGQLLPGAAVRYSNGGLGQTLGWLLQTLWRNALYLAVKVIPIMLLAGLIGSVVVVLVPWEPLVGSLPGTIGVAIVASLVLLALFGLLLPVPMAFDVVLAATLASAGLPMEYVVTLLFVLGSFSVYSYMVLLRAGVRRFATALAGAIALVGVLAGLLAGYLHELDDKQVQAPLFEQLDQPTQNADVGERLPNPYKFGVVIGEPVKFTEAQRHQLQASSSAELSAPVVESFPAGADAPALAWTDVAPGIQRMPLQQGASEAQRFTRVPERQMGLQHFLKPLELNVIEPFPDANAIMSGDIDNDGWIDLVLSSSHGSFTFLNKGGFFEPAQRLRGEASARAPQGAAALVDLDNNGYLDLVFSELDSGLWLAYNRGGTLGAPQNLPATGYPGRHTKALAFMDLNGDGYLEIVTGNSSGMVSRRISNEPARNQLLVRGANGQYSVTDLPGRLGETLSVYLGDIDGDGTPELIEGNDFDEPDLFSSIDNTLSVTPWDDSRVSSTTHWTMSIDTADVDNDLVPEVYIGNVTQSGTTRPFRIPQTRGLIEDHCLQYQGPYCRSAVATANTRRAVAKQDASACAALDEDFELACIAAVYHKRLDSAVHSETDLDELRDKAGLLEAAFPVLYHHLMRMTEAQLLDAPTAKRQLALHIPQETEINNLMFLEGDRLVNRSREFGVDITGWTWNARFADLDSDGWQDLYVVNGNSPLELEITNVLFRNIEGERFQDITKPAGLRDFEPTLAYTYIDFDNDGDLDLVTFSQIGRVAVWRNELTTGNNLQLELRDSLGNSNAIGAKIIVRHDDGSAQLRELKMSGGHMSFDAGIAHFGLGDREAAVEIEIIWPEGGRETYRGPFEHGHRHRVTR